MIDVPERDADELRRRLELSYDELQRRLAVALRALEQIARTSRDAQAAILTLSPEAEADLRRRYPADVADWLHAIAEEIGRMRLEVTEQLERICLALHAPAEAYVGAEADQHHALKAISAAELQRIYARLAKIERAVELKKQEDADDDDFLSRL